MNKLTVIGNITMDPITKKVNTSHGPETVTEIFLGVNGRDRTKNTYVKATAWGKAGQTIAQYAKAKTKMFLSGEAKASAYLAKDTGELKSSLELTVSEFEFLGSNSGEATSTPAPRAETPAPVKVAIPTEWANPLDPDQDEDGDDDLPF